MIYELVARVRLELSTFGLWAICYYKEYVELNYKLENIFEYKYSKLMIKKQKILKQESKGIKITIENFWQQN